MEKKIGILTFHNSVNYGAVMQTYALQEFLKKNDYNVEIIDYINEKIDSELHKKIVSRKSSFKAKIKGLYKIFYRRKKHREFEKFNRKYLNLSSNKNISKKNIARLCNNYDVIITGSDQVWNLTLTGNDLVYFLNFADKNIKRISYAASAGDKVNNISNDAIKELKKFHAISVREKNLYDFLKEKCKIYSSLCCDPTLLNSRECFERIIENKKKINKKYIFCFLMEEKKELIKYAKKLAADNNCELINNKSSKQFFLHSTPDDFLCWIKNAEYILTDSFHVTVFSIIFEKKFLSDMYDNKKNLKSRINDLLTEFGLKNRFADINFDNYNNLEKIIKSNIDYEHVKKKVDNYSRKSSKWLLSSIEDNE